MAVAAAVAAAVAVAVAVAVTIVHPIKRSTQIPAPPLICRQGGK